MAIKELKIVFLPSCHLPSNGKEIGGHACNNGIAKCGARNTPRVAEPRRAIEGMRESGGQQG